MDETTFTIPQLLSEHGKLTSRNPEAQALTGIAMQIGMLLAQELVRKKIVEVEQERDAALAERDAAFEDRDNLLIDSVTGLPNRVSFTRNLEETLNTHPNPENLALVVIDLDKLKYFNDRFGHSAGDEYLRLYGQFLNEHLRRRGELAAHDNNIAGRAGGDEFWALIDLPDRGDAESTTIGERIEHFIEWLRHDFDETVKGTKYKGVAGFSIGVAGRKYGQSVNDWLKSADDIMYAEKEIRARGRL